jgi:predicted dehydrogenase
MNEDRKKAGIIGCGGIAQVHAWALRSMKDVDLVAFCDSEKDKAKAFAGSDALACDNWRKFCKLDLDVVHICTPHYLHAPMAVELLRSGKAVFVEKPCAITLKQFRELETEDKKHPGKLGFCFQNRYNETTRLIDKIVSEGRLGKILGARAMVTWRRDEDYYESSLWKGKRATEGGGVLINQAIHTLDLMLKYMGDPVEIKGNTNNNHLNSKDIDVEDTVEAWMSFPNGGRACFYASNAYVTDAPVYLELQGECGRVYLNGSEVTVCINSEKPEHFLLETQKGIGKDYWGCGHKECIEDFYRSLDTGKPYINSLEGVKRTFNTLIKIYESAGNLSES